jgi:nucleoside-diphosphate-sugar epimerase
MKGRGASALILTGSVFEADEGAGDLPLRAFSPYGLSKTLTWRVAQYMADRAEWKLGKFVIPNPFGPWEEPRFTTYLARTWLSSAKAEVKTPMYVRDNIHVGLLALGYMDFVEDVVRGDERVARLNPSGYVESQGVFTSRFADAMRSRLDLPCDFELAAQQDFSEPTTRVNTEQLRPRFPDWSEHQAWDELADYYRLMFRNT